MNLFDGTLTEAQIAALKAAGWTVIDYWGLPAWKSPQGYIAQNPAQAWAQYEAQQSLKEKLCQ